MEIPFNFPGLSDHINNVKPLVSWFWIVPLVASGISAIAAARSQRKSREAAKAESELAFQRSQQQIAEQNEYNSPQNQMQRYTSAGLNPNMIYGSGPSSAGNQPSTARYEAAEQQFTNNFEALPQMLGQYQDFQLKKAQIDNVKAQTENTHSRTMTEAITRYVKRIQGKTGEFDLDRREYLRPYEAAITGNRARASEAQLQQEFQKLTLMSQQEQTNLLNQQYKERTMTAVDLDNEKRQADILFLKYKNEWAKHGITASDNMLLRIFVRMINESGFTMDNINPFGK